MSTPFEKRLSLTIFFFQLVGVLLVVVSIIYYLAVVYIPSYNAFTSKGFSEHGVTCSSVQDITLQKMEISKENDSSNDSNEFSSSTSQDARQSIKSNIRLEECDPTAFETTKSCQVDTKVYRCGNGECADLNGLFNCSTSPRSPSGEPEESTCKNVASLISCNISSREYPLMCNIPACRNYHGLYEFKRGQGARIRPPLDCKKLCQEDMEINTHQKDVIIKQNSDSIVHTGKCSRAVDIKTGVQIWPIKAHQLQNQVPLLLMSCKELKQDVIKKTTYEVVGCVNGELLKSNYFGDSTNTMNILQGEYNVLGRLVALDIGVSSENETGTTWFQCFDSKDFVPVHFQGLKTVMGLLIGAAVPLLFAIVCCCIMYTATIIGSGSPKKGVMGSLLGLNKVNT